MVSGAPGDALLQLSDPVALDVLVAAFEQAPVAVSAVTPDGRRVAANPALAELTGRPIHELVGNTCWSLVHPLDVESDRAHFDDLLNGRAARYELDVRYVRPDGSHRWVHLTAGIALTPDGRPVYADDQGRPQYVIRQLQDISARRAAEQALQEANLALRARTTALVEANRELDEMGRVLVHDIANPLTILGGFLEMLEASQSLGEREREWAAAARRAYDRVESVVAGLHPERRHPRGVREHLDMTAVVQSVVSALEPTLAAAGATVHVDPLPQVVGDPDLLATVVQNLLVNACKYRHPERPLEIRLSTIADDGAAHVVVADNGRGVPAGEHARIFRAHVRGSDVGHLPGSGTGLATVRSIVETFGGDAWATDAPGGGLEIHLLLPS